MRLVVVSNRVSLPSNDGVQAGGMTVGIEGALRHSGGVWVGWSGRLRDDDKVLRRHESANGIDYMTLDLPAREHAGYYAGFANQVLWPLFHGRHDLAAYDAEDYAHYLQVNARFADELVRQLRADDVVWVHDYHFVPMAHALRGRGICNRIGFFLHTPFGAPGDLMRLPVRDDLAGFLEAYDLIGFQTQADVHAFHGFMAAQSLVSERHPMRRANPPRSAAFPIGIDAPRFATTAQGQIADEKLRVAFDRLGQDALPIISVDRLDYSKGIPERLRAMDAFMTRHPRMAALTGLIQVAPTSRSSIPAYQAEAERVQQAHADLMTHHCATSRPAAQLITEPVDRRSIAAAYRRSRIGLVTPLRDGMNLVAKEFVAAQDAADPGVLILSRMAGAGEELEDGALMVDPSDTAEVARALHQALAMKRGERQERWSTMIETVRRNDVANWSKGFLEALTETEPSLEPVPRSAMAPIPLASRQDHAAHILPSGSLAGYARSGTG